MIHLVGENSVDPDQLVSVEADEPSKSGSTLFSRRYCILKKS